MHYVDARIGFPDNLIDEETGHMVVTILETLEQLPYAEAPE